ncbi:MAG: hypothetical protein ACKPJT_00040, partial [Microcystis panniformis]
RRSKPRVFIGPRPVGAKHSGNNLSVKPEIFYPNASPVLFQHRKRVSPRNPFSAQADTPLIKGSRGENPNNQI